MGVCSGVGTGTGVCVCVCVRMRVRVCVCVGVGVGVGMGMGVGVLVFQTARLASEADHRQCNTLTGERSLQAYLTETIQGRLGAAGGNTPAAILLGEVYGEPTRCWSRTSWSCPCG